MKTTIDLYEGLFSEGQKILCAVSGGPDSMCLLHYLTQNAEKLGISVCAAHFNHRLRGAEADRDERFVEKWCAENGIRYISGSADVAAFALKNGLGIEDAARRLRYEFLESAADDLKCDLIATAHNCDDNAETVLYNLTRGSGTKGLCGIPPVRGRIIRPLLGVCRSEIETYLDENNVPFVTDSTNLTDDYTRNVLRHRVMPVLREINPAFSDAVLRTSEILRSDDRLLTDTAAEFAEKYYIDNSLPVSRLKTLPEPVITRVLHIICGSGLTAQQTEAVIRLLDSGGLKHCDIHGMRITKDRDRLYFGQSSAVFPDTVIIPGKTVCFSDLGLTVKAGVPAKEAEIFKSLNNFCFNYEKICGTISLTARREGDKIRLAGRGCTKSLKELYREKGMTQPERDVNPVIRDEKGVIAVYGFGIAERCAAKKGDTVLRITVEKSKPSGDKGK